jgi:flavodoxin
MKSMRREEIMNVIRSLLGRRQFLIALISAAVMSAVRRMAKVFGVDLKGGVAPASAAPAAGGTRELRGCVVYYSATGSTGKIAGAIHRGMKSVMACDVAPIKKMDPQKMARYDVIAVGGPIWYFRETANLRLFVYNMPRMDGKLCVTFCTHGTNPDGFFYSLSTQILKKGLKIIGWDDWYGGCSHVLHQPSGPEDGFFVALNEAEKTGRFRRLVPLDQIGWDNIVMNNPNAPRVVLKPEDSPYEVN